MENTDLIRRSDALELCQKEYDKRLQMFDYCGDTVAYNIGGAIKLLPAVDSVPAKYYSCWDYPTVIKGHEIPVPHCRRCGTHNTDKSKYCPECGACMDGNEATNHTPEECAERTGG